MNQPNYVLITPLKQAPVRSFSGPEPVLDTNRDYRARLNTSQGTMLVDLFQDQAPVTVNNFVFLALHRYYNDIVFHRVLDDFMAQTGDPTGTGTGGPGYSFADEFHPELTHDTPGVLSMANSGPGTNGSQFFITFTATPWLDNHHTVFGKVIEGEEVLADLTHIDPSTPGGQTPDHIENVEILAAT